MRSTATDTPARSAREGDSVDDILTELSGWMADLRCASMGRLVQGHVSLAHLHVLFLLQHHGAMPMSRLADLLGVSLSNATGLIDRMADHGLVERVRVPDDRRIVLVQPAEAGLEALSATETTKQDRMRSVLRHLNASERGAVVSALRSLRRALSTEVETSDGHHHHFEAAH